jgi:hypothetical protein
MGDTPSHHCWNTKSWSTWMIWGTPHDIGNLYMFSSYHDIPKVVGLQAIYLLGLYAL